MRDPEENIATKALLLQEHQMLLRTRTATPYFYRVAFIGFLSFIIVVNPSVRLFSYTLASGAFLLALSWIAETLTIQHKIHFISMSLGQYEEGRGPQFWEDSHIRYEYFLSQRLLLVAIRYFALVEPLLWSIVIVMALYRLRVPEMGF